MVWYSHLFNNFPQFVVIHTVKSFNVVNKAEVNVFLKISCYFYDLMDVCSLSSGSSAFSKSKILGKKGAPLVSQIVKNLPAMQEIWIQPLGFKDPLMFNKSNERLFH